VELLKDRQQRRTIGLWAAAFVALLTFVEFQVSDEWAQIAIAWLANLAFGYAVGHLWHGRPRSTYVAVGLATGVAHWLLIVGVSLIFYAGAAAYPVATWFVRFALGGALLFIAGAIIGDLSARKKVTVNMAVVAGALGIAGSILTLIKG
jgi:hypothetical protein